MYKFQRIRKKIFLLVDRFITISTPLTSLCMQFGIKKNAIDQIEQGVDTKIFSPVSIDEKIKIRLQLSLPVGVKIAIFVGAIIERKGISELMSVWEEVQKSVDNVLLLLVGPYKFEQQEHILFVNDIMTRVRDKHLSVAFVGAISNVEDFLRASDVFVFPSRKEGFGNVIIEAMSCGLPCIVTEMDGVAYDTVVDGETGYIVTNQVMLQERLKYCLMNAEKLVLMGRKARMRAEAYFNFNNIAEKYCQTYNKCDGGKSREV